MFVRRGLGGGGGKTLLGIFAFLCLAFCLRNFAYLVGSEDQDEGVVVVDPDEGLPSVRDAEREATPLRDPAMERGALAKEEWLSGRIVALTGDATTTETNQPKRRRKKKRTVSDDGDSPAESDVSAKKLSPDPAVKDESSTSLTKKDQEGVPPTLQNKEKKVRAADAQLEFSGSNLLTTDGLQKQLQSAKNQLQIKLRSTYTDQYYWNIFDPGNHSMGDHFFYKSPGQIMNSMGAPQPVSEASLGWNRMVRLLQIKFLEVQLGVIKQQQRRQQPDIPLKQTYATLRWITSGNGQASGSGNFFRESFTAVLESALQDAFRSLGIHFTAQNYAMKSMSSGDELALCQDQIYPSSDIHFWDFDMTDEKDYWKLAMFGTRLAQRSNTALIAFTRTKGHTAVLAGLEQKGMTVLGRDWQVQGQQNRAFPDSAAMSDDQLKALPPQLQYIRCGKEIEDGGPQVDVGGGIQKKLCRAFKFNVTVCPDRPHKYIWHPSFRTNAIKGYTLALMLLELLEDAIQQLPTASKLEDREAQLQQELDRLQEEQRKDYEGIHNAIPSGLGKWYKQEESKHSQLHQEIDLVSLFGAPALCRTALLPSSSRYQYQTVGEGVKVTTPYNNTYERGIMYSKLRKQDGKVKGGFRYPEKERGEDMVITTDKSSYFDCPEEPLLIDHQDAFLVSSKMGWRSMTLPNENERQTYDTANAKGWVFLCLFICDNSKCPEVDLHDRVYHKKFHRGQDPAQILAQYGQVEMEVNGVSVHNYTRLVDQKYSHLDNCVALRHDSDSSPYTWKANDEGTYVLKVRIVGATMWSYVKISSVILM